ncbi:flagellar hook-basal body complex protein [Acidisphaera sp. L21]|uniref:flagellar hook-basal body complex protein n=1 Tax=Acidisphaera sp. L21 TaxID=1641851 RepID=UPI00131BC303|nr:flagellar hook-basal body complex protein [Acidisphaera sp. L21]
MQNSTSVALSRLVAQQRAMDVTAMNLANANTPGFKTGHTLFADWLDNQTGVNPPQGGRQLAFTQDRATYRDQAEGTVSHTANPLDIAITGDGFFTVQTKAGPMLTRAGRFNLQNDGTVVDIDGNALLDTGGQPLKVSSTDTSLAVTGDGTLSSENGRLGKIGIVKPADLYRMQAQGDHLFTAQTATTPVAQPKLIGGALEESNVQPVAETTRMINELRQFQFVTQFVQGESDRQQSAIDKITQHLS